jgi:catechol 2,3-dioxygenase-like lactoylglutathione lyase family enzyme
MARGARLGTVVMFVPDLDRSVSFYLEVLGLEVTDRSPTAALLISAEGSQLVLRSMGSNAPHALGSIGVQYVIWIADGKEDLDRAEGVLRGRSVHRQTRSSGGRGGGGPRSGRHRPDDHLSRPGSGAVA